MIELSFDLQPVCFNGGVHDFRRSPSQAMNTNLRPPGADNCALEIVGGNGTAMGGRVGRYNAEERRERIERYRNKRNQRNFQKKITYVCRKTLADSRPRIRGRFARNGDAELETDAEAGEVSSSSGGVDYRGWRPAVDGEDCSYDPDFWANFLDNLSVGNMIA
ncbi:unnamed protein product [Spirodela intermedia]|uniref:CCT domain-containing protein n=2 Tax=Spirodela intermedia TaxID=51605 RepID=A0A7I8K1X4_SPIIN|nr:unnamed protein product [Spirodela intermedia]CAA6654847.1 unnamed protein product [Spirodela intermedia]CAA7389541.1 unnamed protein product [Spirodela intermedia]